MEKKANASNAQTRASLTEALISLSRKKAFSSITVTELCSAAGVSRMAFYRNYHSKEEVFSSRLAELVDEYKRSALPLLSSGEFWYDMGHLTMFFEIMQENADLVDSLFKSGFTGLLIEAIASYIKSAWGDGTRETEYVLTGFSGFLCSCYAPWAQNGFKESPRQMAELLNQFCLVPSLSAK